MKRRLTLLALLTALSACEGTDDLPPADPREALPGGTTTVQRFDQNAFSLPSANLAPSRRMDFFVGNSFFRNPWVIAPATTDARDGLGPLFNTNACQNCHIKDGRGHPPGPEAVSAVSTLVRLSIPATPDQAEQVRRKGLVPEPTYGGQLQDAAIPGAVAEGRVRMTWTEEPVALADGTVVSLRRPTLHLDQLGYGPMHPSTLFSVRVAPPLIGLGLLEAIPDEALLALEDPDDRDGNGIRGRANRVWSVEQQATVLGRFGWKAGNPGLNQQNADAFANDMGLTSSLFPVPICTPAQPACRELPDGGSPEVSDSVLGHILFYTRNLAVPARRQPEDPQVLAGRSLFHQAGCQHCHVPSHRTRSDAAEPELADQLIWPYTDLLLHDMGDGLADGRPEYRASGRDWRTPPLWGIGLTQAVSGHTQFLHDGRARNLLEAILWHGGEAESAREAVRHFSAAERDALLAFLESL